MPDTGSAKSGFVVKSCPVLEPGHCPCSQEPPLAAAAAHRNFFCCPDFVVWPSPRSASVEERRGQCSATVQRSCGLQFLFARGFKSCNFTKQALGFIALTPALQSGNGRGKKHIPGLWHFAQLPWQKHSIEKKIKNFNNQCWCSCSCLVLQNIHCFLLENKQQRKKLWWADVMAQTLLHNLEDHSSEQAEKWVCSWVTSHSKKRKTTVMVSNSKSNKKWAGQPWRRESLSFCYLLESNYTCFSWSNLNYLKIFNLN